MANIFGRKLIKLTSFFKLVLILMSTRTTDCQLVHFKALFSNNSDSLDASNCTIKPIFKKSILALTRNINENNRLIELDIAIKWNTLSSDTSLPSSMKWFLTTKSGRNLLFLPENFTLMSLGTLSFGISSMHIPFRQEPEDCLSNMSAIDADILMKHKLLNLVSSLDLNKDEEVPEFSICNGTRDTNGFCCEISLTGKYINCVTLSNDILGEILRYVLWILLFIVLTQCVSWIPRYMYMETNEHKFKLHDLKMNMNVIVLKHSIKTLKYSDEWTDIRSIGDDSIFEGLQDKLRNLINSTNKEKIFKVSIKATSILCSIEEKSLQSESFPPFGFFDFLCLKDIFHLCKPQCRCSGSLMVTFVFAVVLSIYALPWLLLNMYLKSSGLFFVILYFFPPPLILLSWLVFCIFWRMIDIKAETDRKRDLEEMSIERILATLKIKTFKDCSILSNVVHLFPLINFVCILITNTYKCIGDVNPFDKIKVLFLFFCGTIIVLFIETFYLIILCTAFYVECLFCMILGLILNYENVFPIAILVLLVVKFTYDTVSDAQRKMNEFTIQVFRALRDFSQEFQDNVANRDHLLHVNGDHCLSRFLFGRNDDKKVRLCLIGLAILKLKIEPEQVHVRHIHRDFIRQVSSLPGHLTPGSKSSLLLKCFKEFLGVILLFAFILYSLLRFGKESEISGSVKTISTIITGTFCTFLSRLYFQDTTFFDSDKDLFFKDLLRNFLAKYEEHLSIEKVDFDLPYTFADEVVEEAEEHQEVERQEGEQEGEQQQEQQQNQQQELPLLIEKEEEEKRPLKNMSIIVTEINTDKEGWYIQSDFTKRSCCK